MTNDNTIIIEKLEVYQCLYIMRIIKVNMFTKLEILQLIDITYKFIIMIVI